MHLTVYSHLWPGLLNYIFFHISYKSFIYILPRSHERYILSPSNHDFINLIYMKTSIYYKAPHYAVSPGHLWHLPSFLLFSLSMALQPLGPWPLFLFLKPYTQSVGLLGRGISSSQGHCLHRTTQTQNKRTQISMPRVGFEPTIPVFERAKTVHALDRAVIVLGSSFFLCPNILLNILFS
jgi:hypothetical protein